MPAEAVDRATTYSCFQRVDTPRRKNESIRAGIGLLAENLGIPVLPMRIDGLFEVKKAGRKFAKP